MPKKKYLKITIELEYSITKLSNDDGGGYMIEFPSLPGCVSDGETILETLESGKEAVEAWVNSRDKNSKLIKGKGRL